MNKKILAIAMSISASVLVSSCSSGTASSESNATPSFVATVSSVTGSGQYTATSCSGLESGSICNISLTWSNIPQNISGIYGVLNVNPSPTGLVSEGGLEYVLSYVSCILSMSNKASGSCILPYTYASTGSAYESSIAFSAIYASGGQSESSTITATPITISGN